MGWAGLIWIDAICIDQKNISERNQQVSIVHKIYSAAKEVVVWLGMGTPESDHLFDVSPHSPGMADVWNISDEILAGIIDILRRPYWARVWIVQELVQASEVSLMCGERILRWEQFRWLVGENVEDRDELHGPLSRRLIDSPGSFGPLTLDDLEQWLYVSQFFWTYGRDHIRYGSLAHLLHSFGSQGCFDKRDRIYSLIGLVSADNEMNRCRYFEVDYNSSAVDLFHNTLNALHRNNEEPNLQKALDLTVLLELDQTCSDAEKNQLVTVTLPSIGVVGSQVDRGFDKILTHAKAVSSGVESSKIDDWVHNGNLATSYTSVDEIVVLESQHLRAQDCLYSIDIDLACLRRDLRPRYSLVARTGQDESNIPMLRIGLLLYPTPGKRFLKGVKSGPEVLLLLQWRRLMEHYLRAALFNTPSKGGDLTLTTTVGNCIEFSKALLRLSNEWQ